MANVVLPFDGDFDRLRAILARWGWEVGERPHAPVFATGPGVALHAYQTGKILLSGPRAQEYAAALREEGAGGEGAGSAGAGSEGRAAPPPASRLPAPRRAPSGAPPQKGYVLHFDGACLPQNPGGVAAYGYVVLEDGRLVQEGHGLAAPPGPGATNNVAEFTGLVEGLRWLRAHAKPGAPIRVRGDSKLVVNTVTGHWNVHVAHLKPLHAEAVRLAKELGAKVEWVPRAQNAEADRLSEIGVAEAIRAHPEWGL